MLSISLDFDPETVHQHGPHECPACTAKLAEGASAAERAVHDELKTYTEDWDNDQRWVIAMGLVETCIKAHGVSFEDAPLGTVVMEALVSAGTAEAVRIGDAPIYAAISAYAGAGDPIVELQKIASVLTLAAKNLSTHQPRVASPRL